MLFRSFQPAAVSDEDLPGLSVSLLTALLPVFLLSASTIASFVNLTPGPLKTIFAFIGDPSIAMLISLIAGTWTLGISRGLSMSRVMDIYAGAVRDVAMVVLIMGGAGGLKQVLNESGVSLEIAGLLDSLDIEPLVLGWLIAALIRVSVGSATVAGQIGRAHV